MKLSIRNQLSGTVESILTCHIMVVVKVALAGGQTITSSITKEAAEDLGLSVGTPVTVLVKSTGVMLAAE